MARIAVAGFRHETNTFAPAKASLTDFRAGLFLAAADPRPRRGRGG